MKTFLRLLLLPLIGLCAWAASPANNSIEKVVHAYVSIDNLLSIDPNIYDNTVVAEGLHTSGDNGGGVLRYYPTDTAPTNTSTVFKPNNYGGRWWVLIGPGTNNPPGGFTNAITALTQDVTATGPGSATATVTGIQTKAVSTNAPTQNQGLNWNNLTAQWEPVTRAEAQSCLAVATSNVSSLSGTTTIDGVSLTAGNRVLLTAQSTASQNGPWTVQSGAWTRPSTYAAGQSVPPSLWVAVAGGAVYANTFWQLAGTTSSSTVDTTSTTWKQIAPTPGALTNSTATTAGQLVKFTSTDKVSTAPAPEIGIGISRFIINTSTNASDASVNTTNYSRFDAQAVTLFGGYSGFPQKIGDTNWITTADSTQDTNYWINFGWKDVLATNSVDVTTIAGGYDSLNNQIGGTIGGGGHNEIRVGDNSTAGHGTIPGGSRNRIFSGNYSTIGGGHFNTETNANSSVISGGEYNSILNSDWVTAGGFSNIVEAVSTASTVSGNQNLVSNSQYSATSGSFNTNRSHYTSMSGANNNIPAPGEPTSFDGRLSVVSGQYTSSRGWGARNHGSYKFFKNGDAQSGSYVLGRSVASTVGPSSATELRLDASTDFIFVPTNAFWTCSALVSAVSTDGSKYASWRVDFCLKKTDTTGMTFPGSNIVQLAVSANSATNWVIAPYARSLSADYWLGLQATSDGSATVRWHALMQTSELSWGP